MWPFKKKTEIGTQSATPRNSPDVYLGLRSRALATKPQDIGLTIQPSEPYGVLMETGYATAIATLVAMGEGSVSLYFSTGGGMIGGSGHDSVRTAGLQMVGGSRDFLSQMTTTTEFPSPAVGQVRFYVLTGDVVYTRCASENDLGNKQDPLWPLFYLGQNVITVFRLATENSQ